MRSHSKFVGAFDALILLLAAFITAALIASLVDPLTPTERLAARHATPVLTEYADAQALRL